MKEDIWYSVFEVLPKPGNSLLDSTATGAWVNIFSVAFNENDFIKKTNGKLDELCLEIIEYEEVTRISDKSDLNDYFFLLADKAEKTGDVILSTLHAY